MDETKWTNPTKWYDFFLMTSLFGHLPGEGLDFNKGVPRCFLPSPLLVATNSLWLWAPMDQEQTASARNLSRARAQSGHAWTRTLSRAPDAAGHAWTRTYARCELGWAGISRGSFFRCAGLFCAGGGCGSTFGHKDLEDHLWLLDSYFWDRWLWPPVLAGSVGGDGIPSWIAEW